MKITLESVLETEVTLDIKALVDVVASTVPDLIRLRVSKGLDVNDAPFAAYSASYRATLTAMGEAHKVDLRVTGEAHKVDLRVTGGLMNSVAAHEVIYHGPDVATVIIGPDTGTSPVVHPPTKGRPRAARTGERGPPHNVVGRWHHTGAGRNPVRKWCGLSPQDRRRLDARLARTRLVRERRVHRRPPR